MGSVSCESKTLSKIIVVADVYSVARPRKVVSVLHVFRRFSLSLFLNSAV